MVTETLTTISPILMDHAVVGPPQGQWAVEHWEKLPASEHRYELIDGVLYMTTAPSSFHQWIIGNIITELGVPARQQKLGIWYTAPIGVILGRRTAIQPDFIFISSQNLGIVRERRIHGPPDLVVEVLSPGNSTEEMAKKRAAYAAGGVPEYVEIDPAERALLHYLPSEPGRYAEPLRYNEAATVTFACLPTVPLTIAALFADAPDSTL
jgi:Uma2 family endonuclease